MLPWRLCQQSKPLIVHCVSRYVPQDTSFIKMDTVLGEKFGVVLELGCFCVMDRRRYDRQVARCMLERSRSFDGAL